MKGTIKYYVHALAVFFIITSAAFALVGDLDDADIYIQPDQSRSGAAVEKGIESSSSIEEIGSVGSTVPYQGISSISKSSLYRAPSIEGPVEDRLTAEELGLSIPQAESYVPDDSLNFASYDEQDSAMSGFQAGSGLRRTTSLSPGSNSLSSTGPAAVSGDWYYPGKISSANRFYVQTASGFGTVAGCSYRGYLPLWADIRSRGNFFVYEWYPGESSPLVRSWGWSEAGYKKGWFTGDVPGWHTICYYCGSWSNYIYIYVYPSMQSSLPSTSSSTYLAGERASLQPSIPSTIPSTMSPSMISSLPVAGQSSMQLPLPAGSPTPPDIYSEQLALPNFNMYPPAAGQVGKAGYVDRSASGITSPAAVVTYPIQGYSRGLEGKTSSAKTTTTCTTSTLVTDGVYSQCPYVDDSGCCQDDEVREGYGAPAGYRSKSSKAVFPKPSKCRCNEYYVLSCEGDTDTVAGVYSGEWIPLWSKISRSGEYWSYEWKVCQNAGGKGCSPEVEDFGSKNAGWYQTWFMGSEPGWHILSYHCNDWSNYVYIYVWPVD